MGAVIGGTVATIQPINAAGTDDLSSVVKLLKQMQSDNKQLQKNVASIDKHISSIDKHISSVDNSTKTMANRQSLGTPTGVGQ